MNQSAQKAQEYILTPWVPSAPGWLYTSSLYPSDRAMSCLTCLFCDPTCHARGASTAVETGAILQTVICPLAKAHGICQVRPQVRYHHLHDAGGITSSPFQRPSKSSRLCRAAGEGNEKQYQTHTSRHGHGDACEKEPRTEIEGRECCGRGNVNEDKPGDNKEAARARDGTGGRGALVRCRDSNHRETTDTAAQPAAEYEHPLTDPAPDDRANPRKEHGRATAEGSNA